jgi:imidazolonepropionase-like amidohydrolase
VAAHSTTIDGARIGVDAHVDSIEHGADLDEEVVKRMAKNGIFLVSTLAVLKSFESFTTTTTIPRFTGGNAKQELQQQTERWIESIRLAHEYGVKIATGTDFGGGSLRANQLPWEVEALVEAGFEPWEALGAATWRGGELLGEPDAGIIREGGPADFVLVHGNPLVDPSTLWRVWRTGWRT